MQRRTFLIGTAGLATVPAVAMAEGGWSKPSVIHFPPGASDLSQGDKELDAAIEAFRRRPNPRRNDQVRIVGYIDDAELRQGKRDLGLERAERVAYFFKHMDGERGAAPPRLLPGKGLLVDVAGPSAQNRVVLISWRLRA